MNEFLTGEVSESEVPDAIFQLGGSKAPRSDELLSMFYQRFQSIVGLNVIAMLQS